MYFSTRGKSTYCTDQVTILHCPKALKTFSSLKHTDSCRRRLYFLHDRDPCFERPNADHPVSECSQELGTVLSYISSPAISASYLGLVLMLTQDHGKTSLTDALLATNGIISPKLAGKIRYLDSRPDEQLRGITMESSAISLYFSMLRRSAPDAAPEQNEYLINLIDSPGHIDFSSEVSTASRLCDGAVVLVDAVEGVCSQTVTVLRQTWVEHMKPILVINKMDRLITELKMTPGEAYTHLSKLVEQVNAVIGSFFQGERMEEDLNWREKMDEKIAAKEQERLERESTDGASSASVDTENLVSHEFEEKDDEDLYFAPEKNNVIFSSAIDGWAFTVRQFASLYEKKLGIKRTAMEKVLWGDFYLDPKTKKVLAPKHLKGRNLKPMFVQLVLEQVWAVYTATMGGDKGKGCVDFLSLLQMFIMIIKLNVVLSLTFLNLVTLP